MLYIVGGTVRDLVAGKAPKDLDLVVDNARHTAEALCHITDAHFFVLDHERNTVRVYLGQERWQLDISSLNGSGINEDLSQRDFSINAMAIQYGLEEISDADNILDLLGVITGNGLKLDEQLIDPYNGRQDLHNHLIVKVSDQIFVNDPVRMMRAVRLAGQLECAIESNTEKLIREQASLLKGSASERLREEFMLILSIKNTNMWLDKLVEIGLIEQLLPSLSYAWECKDKLRHPLATLYAHSLTAVSRMEELGNADYTPFMSSAIQLKKDLMQQLVPGRTRLQVLKLAGLMHDLGKTSAECIADPDGKDNHASIGADIGNQVCESLALSRRETDTITRLIRNHYRIFEIYHQNTAIGIDIYTLIEDLGNDYPLLVLLAWADWQSGKTDGIKKEQHFQEFLRFLIKEYYENYLLVKSKPLVTGQDVMEILEIEPSPKVGQILDQVRKSHFMRELATREAAVSYLQSLKM